ncbi:MAG: hypothetical protein H6679_03505 [Epsilonproteobacteria bacterium]|nr:hypothetical protein [Campylobacterota bacterium]
MKSSMLRVLTLVVLFSSGDVAKPFKIPFIGSDSKVQSEELKKKILNAVDHKNPAQTAEELGSILRAEMKDLADTKLLQDTSAKWAKRSVGIKVLFCLLSFTAMSSQANLSEYSSVALVAAAFFLICYPLEKFVFKKLLIWFFEYRNVSKEYAEALKGLVAESQEFDHILSLLEVKANTEIQRLHKDFLVSGNVLTISEEDAMDILTRFVISLEKTLKEHAQNSIAKPQLNQAPSYDTFDMQGKNTFSR